ncbi:MAG: hypothetical protein E6Q89_04860 [Bacteroidia bacterium]|nr:MAG: hypothetical protein E6Q89_04860 [Bacteroidia bacterium]
MALSKLKITECRVCKSKKLKEILTLGNYYLSDFYSTNKLPKKYPMDLILCEKCMLLQLRHSTPPKELYTPRYGYKSGINETMRTELKEISEKAIKRANLKIEKPVVIDIGSNDGTLLSNYPKKYFRIGVEPIKKLALESSSKANVVINDFFNSKKVIKELGDRKASIITVISCFYDMEDPNLFVSDLVEVLDEKGIIIIQQNYLMGMLTLNAFDNIVHEHLEYYSLLSMDNLLRRHNLEVFDVELNNTNGGSFRTYIARTGDRKISKSVLELRKKELKFGMHKRKTYEDFAKRVTKIGSDINQFIKEESKKGKKVYVYGASTRGNTLLQYFKLNNKLVPKAVERNPEKFGKKIASLQIPIISEDEARKEKPDYFLVLPWFFKEEFIKREKKFLDGGGHFIFPLPEFEII